MLPTATAKQRGTVLYCATAFMLMRLGRRAGVKGMSGLVWEELCCILKVALENTMRKVAIQCEFDRRTQVMAKVRT